MDSTPAAQRRGPSLPKQPRLYNAYRANERLRRLLLKASVHVQRNEPLLNANRSCDVTVQQSMDER